MCGIVGAASKRDVTPLLLDGLARLEYRGYDSAGIALIDKEQQLRRVRVLGKVNQLGEALKRDPIAGFTGIAHTRWATHGMPSEINAHPHTSFDEIAIVHNGIIENHESLRAELTSAGYTFFSQTDTEVIVHLLHFMHQQEADWPMAVRSATTRLEGAYALGITHRAYPGQIIGIRHGSPLVIGLGADELFLASDPLALCSVAEQCIYLEDGDLVVLTQDKALILDEQQQPVSRITHPINAQHNVISKGEYRHFMQKEIFEQARVIQDSLEGRLGAYTVLEEAFGSKAPTLFDKIQNVQIVACGTSYHAGLVAKYWLEAIAGIACQVEVASEFRYRKRAVQPNTLLICISQSGETADTLAALRSAKSEHYLASLAICNVPQSALVREADLVFMTRAGVEIGVASTKAFTTQLVGLLLLTLVLGRRHGLTEQTEGEWVEHIRQLPLKVQEALALNPVIEDLALLFADKQHALFLGRGVHYPVALEGALKLKEISYIHAEAYPAGELKHGPLALVDKNMPVITVAPNDELLGKLKSNLHEVRARGGELIVFADAKAETLNGPGVLVVDVPSVDNLIAPIIYTIPLQLLAYHVAVLKGTDVDQPRNLAKSVTVE